MAKMKEQIRAEVKRAMSEKLEQLKAEIFRYNGELSDALTECGQLRADSDMWEKRYEVVRANRNELFDENRQLKAENDELKNIYLGQIRVIARSRITYKERVIRMAAITEQALKEGAG